MRIRIGILAFSAVAMLGLVATGPASAEPVQPAPESSAQLAPEPQPYDVIRSYVVKTYTDTYLRRGTSLWGYTHLVARGRWNSTFDSRIATTLRYWEGHRSSGTSHTFELYDSGFGPAPYPWSMRVVVDYCCGNKGVITAYYI